MGQVSFRHRLGEGFEFKISPGIQKVDRNNVRVQKGKAWIDHWDTKSRRNRVSLTSTLKLSLL